MIPILIGDLQGCTPSLDQLLEVLPADAGALYFLGDLVNRGPDSLGVLRKIMAMGERAQCILGNHDLHLLALSLGVRAPGKSDTLAEVLAAPDLPEILDWIRRQPLVRVVENHLLVHAGVLPQWTLVQTLGLAREVEAVLQGSNWRDFIRDLCGNGPERWDDGLTGVDRWRCIVNVMTRIRFCSSDGTLDFASKEGLASAPAGFKPWFDYPDRLGDDVTVVFGHWSALGLLMRPRHIGLDTGCVWGGKLTAMRLPDRALFQVDCPVYRTIGSA